MKRHHRQAIDLSTITPFPVTESAIVGAVTAIETLEALRDQTMAEDWLNPSVKRSVLFGIKLCIATLKRENINEIV